jgi:hypothetical protein
MTLWKSRRLHAIVRKVDEDGLDEDNGPFVKSAVEEAMQTMKDTLEGRERVEEVPKIPNNDGFSGGKRHLRRCSSKSQGDLTGVPRTGTDSSIQGNQRQGGECVPVQVRGVSHEEVQKKPQLGTTL